MEINQVDDIDLVERAKKGDRQAFGELVRRHRAEMYGYARSYTKEPFVAEDIVQDALIRAFLHLGTLLDARRFLPWVHRIVRNQAYTRLRKHQRSNEQLFTTLAPSSKEDAIETNWGDLDSVLHRLSRSVLDRSNQEHNPEEYLMRKENLETITGILGCLQQRERKVVESFFFEQLPPQEIARLFNLTSANVYQILSRSKKRLLREKIRISIDQYINNRKDMDVMTKKVLSTPNSFEMHPNTWTTCASALYGLMEHTDRKYSLPMLMGLSGHAFRMTVFTGDIHIAGPTAFDFRGILQQGLQNMGFTSRVVGGEEMLPEPGPNSNLIDSQLLSDKAREKRELPKLLPEALELIHRSIDQGKPVLVWDLFIPEFGVIYGYDDEQRVLYAGDNCGHNNTVPYENLGRGLIEELFVLAIDEPFDISKTEMLKNALQMILRHYHGGEERFPRSVNGLEAYQVWLDAYRNRSIEPNGNAYNLAVVHDARLYAAAFLQELGDTWLVDVDVSAEIVDLSKAAAKKYREVSNQFAQICKLFPFPSGGDPNNEQQANQAIQLIQTARTHEEEAVALLEQMYERLTSIN